MSPFANSPHLWLTDHIRRLSQEEQATKIQAVMRGYLVRRRREEKQRTDAVFQEVYDNLQPANHTLTLAELMYASGLDTWADGLPTAAEALRDSEAATRRKEALWHASNLLRLVGRSQVVPDLEWADYHERCRAIRASQQALAEPSSLWNRLVKLITG